MRSGEGTRVGRVALPSEKWGTIQSLSEPDCAPERTVFKSYLQVYSLSTRVLLTKYG